MSALRVTQQQQQQTTQTSAANGGRPPASQSVRAHLVCAHEQNEPPARRRMLGLVWPLCASGFLRAAHFTGAACL